MDPFTAILLSSVVSGGAALIGGNKAASAQNKATDAGVKSSQLMVQEQKRQYDQTREDMTPWREMAKAATSRIIAGLQDGSFTLDGFDFQKDPGYEFRLSEGIKALDRSAAARGQLKSGGHMKNALAWGQEYASGEFDRALARRRDDFNVLSAAAGAGQAGVTAGAKIGQQQTGNILNALTYGSNAQMTGAANVGAIQSNMYGNLAGAANQGIENYLTYKMLGA